MKFKTKKLELYESGLDLSENSIRIHLVHVIIVVVVLVLVGVISPKLEKAKRLLTRQESGDHRNHGANSGANVG
jgi:NADH:ubiquinone oxidoreductase subunit 3 (subunit A)